ncbi:hypothetical protein QYE76_003773 [Lolium multiflorum]|uniref:CCHC-type domain-containing protein n=1 Tax=Lolium multiflorum TaxID=4521 RepID=A0AAD8RPD7_LOLMU|nr:hypothetical protein QYE76_003773 [Lolium multiflorum]
MCDAAQGVARPVLAAAWRGLARAASGGGHGGRGARAASGGGHGGRATGAAARGLVVARLAAPSWRDAAGSAPLVARTASSAPAPGRARLAPPPRRAAAPGRGRARRPRPPAGPPAPAVARRPLRPDPPAVPARDRRGRPRPRPCLPAPARGRRAWLCPRPWPTRLAPPPPVLAASSAHAFARRPALRRRRDFSPELVLAAATSGTDEKKGGVGAGVRHMSAAPAVGQASQTPVAIPVISMGKRRQRREKVWGWEDRNGRPELSRASRTDAKSAQIWDRCSVELWEIILHGYREPQDPIRLTSTEFYNRQLNASARDKIRSGINRKLLDQVNDIGSAKELWDRIVVLQEGTDLIQSSLYETAKQEAHRFMIREGESLADAYARLGALKVRIKGLGAEKYDDGFEMNEGFIKSKVIAMIAVKQEDTNLALNLQIMTKSADLNSDDLVSYVAANENMAKAGKMLMAMNRVDEASHNHEASHNLALKARADHGGEEEYEIEEDEEMTSTSDIATDFAFFAKKYKGKLPMLLNDKKKKRTCYNCDEESHFANECPYEKRVDKPKFIKGVKPRLKPNPINDRYKRNKGRAFVGAEYLSDEEEEDEEKEAGVAGLAFSKPGSLFTYDYSKDYSTENDVGSSFMARITQDDDSDDSSSSTTVGSCLMARETKVMEPPPSLSSVLDNEAENQDELTVLKELYNVRCTLRGEALVKFDFLMDSLKEKDESIEELEYHLNDKERRFNLLRQELKTERCISQGLKQQIETYELDKVKDLETIERAQSLTQELNASKEELEVAHASLTRDLDHLERANKLVKDELKKLGKNHDL